MSDSVLVFACCVISRSRPYMCHWRSSCDLFFLNHKLISFTVMQLHVYTNIKITMLIQVYIHVHVSLYV